MGLLERTLKGEAATGVESIRQNHAGERFPLSISTATLYDENGKRSGVPATIEDIRERKRINVELGEKIGGSHHSESTSY